MDSDFVDPDAVANSALVALEAALHLLHFGQVNPTAIGVALQSADECGALGTRRTFPLDCLLEHVFSYRTHLEAFQWKVYSIAGLLIDLQKSADNSESTKCALVCVEERTILIAATPHARTVGCLDYATVGGDVCVLEYAPADIMEEWLCSLCTVDAVNVFKLQSSQATNSFALDLQHANSFMELQQSVALERQIEELEQEVRGLQEFIGATFLNSTSSDLEGDGGGDSGDADDRCRLSHSYSNPSSEADTSRYKTAARSPESTVGSARRTSQSSSGSSKTRPSGHTTAGVQLPSCGRGTDPAVVSPLYPLRVHQAQSPRSPTGITRRDMLHEPTARAVPHGVSRSTQQTRVPTGATRQRSRTLEQLTIEPRRNSTPIAVLHAGQGVEQREPATFDVSECSSDFDHDDSVSGDADMRSYSGLRLQRAFSLGSVPRRAIHETFVGNVAAVQAAGNPFLLSDDTLLSCSPVQSGWSDPPHPNESPPPPPTVAAVDMHTPPAADLTNALLARQADDIPADLASETGNLNLWTFVPPPPPGRPRAYTSDALLSPLCAAAADATALAGEPAPSPVATSPLTVVDTATLPGSEADTTSSPATTTKTSEVKAKKRGKWRPGSWFERRKSSGENTTKG